MTIVKQQSIKFVRYKFCFICWVQNIVTSQQFGFIVKYIIKEIHTPNTFKEETMYMLTLYRMKDNIHIYTKYVFTPRYS